jgi:hypothetical protein
MISGDPQMLNAISGAAAAQPVARPASSSAQPKTQAQPSKASSGGDTVQLSNAAQAAQEARETSAQTAKEAAGGDIQARNLLAREQAASKSSAK